ncbi:XXYS1_4_G0008240.mRNA.1.CDS.1 [Saccharomyces cerevisiae]|nr:XXYS1_4_G0008240.mRNA.1.CDS.1 [Saccharomyces cerevisiae]
MESEVFTKDTQHLQEEETFEEPKSKLWEAAFIAVLCSAQAMTQAGLAQSIVPLHIIGDSFGISNPGQLSWFASAFSLTVGTFILIAGRLGDIFGHKKFFVVGFLWYGLWSLLAGFSVYSNQIFFDCCRAFQGMGPAFALPNAIAIIGRTYKPGKKQNMIFSLFGACAPGGFVLGAVFSSLLSEFAWWPWAYWIMGITCFLLGIGGYLIIPHSQVQSSDEGGNIMERIDVAGSVTGVVGLILFNFAWNQGPVVGWETPYTYALLIVGVVFFAVFGYVEARARYPLLPVRELSSNAAFRAHSAAIKCSVYTGSNQWVLCCNFDRTSFEPQPTKQGYADFTTMLTGIAPDQVTRMITGVPWYSSRLKPAISSALSKDGIYTVAK